MTRAEAEVAYTVREAASIKRVSTDYILAAIKSTEPPFLKAKRVGKGYRIAASALDDWFDGLADA